MDGIYLDNAATSFPKPKEVFSFMRHYMQDVGAPMGRSVYGSSAEVLQTAFLLRESLSLLFNHGGDASHVVLTSGATVALNTVIKGLLGPSGIGALLLTPEFAGMLVPIIAGGTGSASEQVSVVSLDFPGGDNAEVADILAEEYDIFTRCGLHCAPHAHKTLGTFPQGTVRFSIGPYTTEQEIDTAAYAVGQIVT